MTSQVMVAFGARCRVACMAQAQATDNRGVWPAAPPVAHPARMSQLDLSIEAGVSSRHLSFVETGRASASREMVLLLARVLDVPLRDRNELLRPPATRRCTARRRSTRRPWPRSAGPSTSFCASRSLTRPSCSTASGTSSWPTPPTRVVGALLDPKAVAELGDNAMRLMLHPRGLRPHIVNWESGAAALIQWLHRDVLSGFADAATRRLLEELLAYPGVPRAGARSTSTSPPRHSCRSSSARTISSCATSPRSPASARRTTSPCKSYASSRSSRPMRRPRTPPAVSRPAECSRAPCCHSLVDPPLAAAVVSTSGSSRIGRPPRPIPKAS